MLGVVVTTEDVNMAGQYRVFMKAIQQYCSSKGYATLPTCIKTLTTKTELDFAMTPIDTTLFATTCQRPIVGAVPPTLETVFAVFNPNTKKELEMEWSVKYKLKREEWGLYRKNIDSVYGIAHGNLCGQVVGRCGLDPSFESIQSNRDLIGLLTILRSVCVQTSSGILRNPHQDGIKSLKKLIMYKQRQNLSYYQFSDELCDLYDAATYQCGKIPHGDSFLNVVLQNENPVINRTAYELLPEAAQEPINGKVKQLFIAHLLVSNSNNKRLRKHLEDSYSTKTDCYPSTREEAVALLSAFGGDIKGSDGNKTNNNSQDETATVLFNLGDDDSDEDSDSDASYDEDENEDENDHIDPTEDSNATVSPTEDAGVLDDTTIVSNDEGSTNESVSDEESSLEGTAAANALIEVEVGDDSLLSAPEDYGIQEQECEDVYEDSEPVAVACVMIADDASFASTESQTLPDLSTTLQDVLNINNDTTDDSSNDSSPEDYNIRPPHHLSTSSVTTSQPNIPVPVPLSVAGPPVICPERAISCECQLTDALMRTSLAVKRNNISNAVEYYDAIKFKLLRINVTNSLQLKELISTNRLNILLRNINEVGFASTTKSLLLHHLEEARGTPSDSYRNPLLEVFGLTTTHEQVLSPSSPSTVSLQSMLLQVAHDMSKTFPIKWTNQVYSNLVSVSITTPSELLHYISNGTLNSRLKSGGHSGMNPTTIQVLARGASDFHQGRR